MNTLGSYLVANAYSGFSPMAHMSASACSVNGQNVPCDAGFFGLFFALFGTFWVVTLALIILMIVALWRIYMKAGRPGWAAIIPVYNMVVLLEIVNKPTWWIILAFIPFVNVIVGIIVAYHLAKAFGKGAGFTVGMIILPFIFYPILGFGKSTYLGSAAPASTFPPTPPTPPTTPPSPQATV